MKKITIAYDSFNTFRISIVNDTKALGAFPETVKATPVSGKTHRALVSFIMLILNIWLGLLDSD